MTQVRMQVEKLIQQKMQKRGLSRDQAAAQVFKENPELQKQLVDEANDRSRAA